LQGDIIAIYRQQVGYNSAQEEEEVEKTVMSV
jgi:hypothetical protein